MPKIRQARLEENQRRIETAALALFTRQGFHGTNIREIAEKADVSTGAIYTYYPTKEALFVSLVQNYEQRMKPLRDRMFSGIQMPFSKQDIRKLASEIRSIVYDNSDYWLRRNRVQESAFRAGVPGSDPKDPASAGSAVERSKTAKKLVRQRSGFRFCVDVHVHL